MRMKRSRSEVFNLRKKIKLPHIIFVLAAVYDYDQLITNT